MTPINPTILELEVTGGEWIVTETQSPLPGHLTIRRADTGEPLAVLPPKGGRPNWNDAALMCASKSMLEALIASNAEIVA